MEKRSVWSKWFASLLIFFCGLVHASDVTHYGGERIDLSKPEIVFAWLKENAKTADRKIAQDFFADGTALKKNRGKKRKKNGVRSQKTGSDPN